MTSDPHPYEGKVRLRVCGVLIKEGKMLLVKLRSPVTGKEVWTLPGGGLKFGERISQAIRREVREETGLIVTVGELIHINEFIKNNFHAVELYHMVMLTSGKLKTGSDPEWSKDDQIILDTGFFGPDEMKELEVSPDFFRKKFWEQPENFM
ncbi:NUDIX domain-containing protein [Balneola sp. MJW-20]|uniref:NUDIX domain-containing protein n=1 Tax=Gracilimonas aurantiaca TaxID=3234185 RepID=UPI0034651FA0